MLALSGCDGDFDPIQENKDLNFTIFGYLDASADTQWVRVSPLRDQLVMLPIKPDIQVTLEELKSGKKIIMNDSLNEFENGINSVNVWTTMDVKPEQSHHLKAEQPGKTSASLTVTTPAEFPTPDIRCIVTADGEVCTIQIQNVPRLADLQSVWKHRISGPNDDRQRVSRFPHRNDVLSSKSGTYSTQINITEENDKIKLPAGDVMLENNYVFVASGGPEWREDLASLDDFRYTLPEELSNVDEGAGYIVGIVSKKVPYPWHNKTEKEG